MSVEIKPLFLSYLERLEAIVEKVSEDLFDSSLSQDMFSLETNAQVAGNFLLRGFGPLVGKESELLEPDSLGKQSLLRLFSDIRKQLNALPEFEAFDDNIRLLDTAGSAQVELPQSEFIFRYIVPNFMFHMSMVYAIARNNGVQLSKGDFDGLHHYPQGFSFV